MICSLEVRPLLGVATLSVSGLDFDLDKRLKFEIDQERNEISIVNATDEAKKAALLRVKWPLQEAISTDAEILPIPVDDPTSIMLRINIGSACEVPLIENLSLKSDDWPKNVAKKLEYAKLFCSK